MIQVNSNEELINKYKSYPKSVHILIGLLAHILLGLFVSLLAHILLALLAHVLFATFP